MAYILRNQSRMTSGQKTMARAIYLYFSEVNRRAGC